MAIALTEQSAAALLPGGGGRAHVVLFYDSDHGVPPGLRERFAQVAWPRSLIVAELDAHVAPIAARWFGLGPEPAVAIIADGAVLALESDCSAECCTRLVELGAAHGSLLASA